MNILTRFGLITIFASLAGQCSRPETTTTSAATSSPCLASPAEAARSVVANESIRPSRTGYRVQDLLVDPVLRRAWVRVASCEDARRPLTLLPLAANLANTGFPSAAPTDGAVPFATTSFVAPTSSTAPAAKSKAQPNFLIVRDAPVEVVVQSASVRMVLQGRAAAGAAAGEPVDVLLDGPVEAGQQRRRMHGVAVSEHRVEVLP